MARGEAGSDWIEDLPAGLRTELQLEPSESVRVIQSGPRTLLLERDRVGGVPVPGAPALRADVSSIPLPELLGMLHGLGRSGYLHFSYRDHAKGIFLHRGEVVFATSNQRVDRLGECLLRAGVLELDQLREAERCFTPGGRFGKVLVERGFLTPRELWNGVKYQVEEIVRSLFAYPGGTVLFWDGEVQPDNVVRLSLETRRLAAEGVQRSQELRKFLSVLEDPRVRLASAEGFRGTLAGSERAIVDAIGVERSFPDVCRALGFDRESAARSVQLLRLVGAVKLMRLPQVEGFLDDEELRSADAQALRSRVKAFTALLAELAAAVMAVEGGDAVRERLERVLDDATGRFPALLTGIGLGEGASLDPEALVDRALKLPGDREEQLIGALGELVAYLEFEIKNHPAIEAPDRLLASLADLRRAAGG